MNKGALTVFFLLFLFVSSSLLFSKIYIDIDSPGTKKINIAITPPVDMDTSHVHTLTELVETIKKDLDLTGLFESIDPKAFLEETNPHTLQRENINFKSWSMIGAEALLKTGYWKMGQKYRVLVRFYDVITGDALIAKSYECEEEGIKQLGHIIANEIIKAFTGRGSFFGSKIAFVSDQSGKKELYIMNFDGTDVMRITNHRTAIVAPAWSPDGRKLIFTSYLARNPDIYLYDFTLGRMFPLSKREGINVSGEFTPDGKGILLSLSFQGNPEIYIMDLETKKLKRLTDSWGIDVSPTMSPDGSQIAFVSDRAGSPQIYVMNSDGSNVRRITFEGKYNASPKWSPDGKKIVYSSMLDGINFKLFLTNPDGSERIQLTNGPGSDENPSWSPDGKYIIFSSTRDGNSELYLTNITGTYLRRLTNTPFNETHPSWGPVIDFRLTMR